MEHLIVRCDTGAEATRPLTEEDAAEQTARQTALQEQLATWQANTAAADDLRTRASAALTRLDALSTDPTTTDTAAEVRQGLRDVAQIVHAMLRHVAGQLE
jgi:hypothetical protein